MLGEQRDVLAPGAQRRHGQHVERQAIQEVLAEAACCRLGRQIDIGRADQAHIDLDRGATADPLESAILDHAQEPLLDREAGAGDLVDEQTSTIGQLEAPAPLPHRARERAGFVAEQLAVQERLGQRRRVQLDQRPVPAPRQVVQARRDQLLARAALPDHQDRTVQRRDPRHLLQQVEERRRLADQGGQFG